MNAGSAQDQKIQEHMTTELWLATCAIFGLDRSNKSIRSFHYPGLARQLLVSQAMAIVWMLQQRPKIGGGILADEQGLGKTMMALTYLFIISRLERLHIRFRSKPKAHCYKGTSFCPRQIHLLLVRLPLRDHHSGVGES